MAAVVVGGVPLDWVPKLSVGAFVASDWMYKLFLGVIGLVGSQVATKWQVDQAKSAKVSELSEELRKQRRELCEMNIFEMLRTITKLASATNCRTRSNVFLPGRDGKLHIVFSHNMEDAPDLGMTLDSYQGCTGHAWAMGKQTFADLSEVSEPDLQLIWKLRPDQIRLTQDLHAIISTPIFHPYNEDRVVGVLSIDSTGILTESGFDNDERQDDCLQAARAIGKLLYLGDFVDEQGG